MGLPTLLVYRVNRLTYWLSKVLVHIDSIGLPNIIMGHRVIPELWQDEVTPENIAAAMVPMITDKVHREALHESLARPPHDGGTRRCPADGPGYLRFCKRKRCP